MYLFSLFGRCLLNIFLRFSRIVFTNSVAVLKYYSLELFSWGRLRLNNCDSLINELSEVRKDISIMSANISSFKFPSINNGTIISSPVQTLIYWRHCVCPSQQNFSHFSNCSSGYLRARLNKKSSLKQMFSMNDDSGCNNFIKLNSSGLWVLERFAVCRDEIYVI